MLTERGSRAGTARARVAKEMREKRAIFERESMTESWSRRASRDENDGRSESEESCRLLHVSPCVTYGVHTPTPTS